MAIDASIYSQIRQPEPFNPLAEAAQVQQLQGLQNQNRLAALGFQDRERAINDAATQREAVRGFGADTTANYNRLLQTGNLKAAQDYQKNIQEQQKTASEISAKDFETASKRLEVAGQAFGYVRANPTLENAISTIAYLEQNGILQPDQAQQYRQTVQSNPQAVGQLAEQAFRSTLEAKEQLGQIKVTNLGGTSQTTSVDPVTNQVRVLADTPITQSADNRASVGASMANAAAVRETANATRDAARITARAKDETDLRKEFADLPEVKKYKNAIPAYQAVVKASKTNNPQADINLIYGVAKLYDPDSVVREGEYDTIANSQAIPEWIKGQAQRLMGGGKLTEATKKQILEQAKIRVDSYKSEVEGAQSGYRDIASRRGMNAENVFVPIGQQVDQGGGWKVEVER
jgi:hypothetical protein